VPVCPEADLEGAVEGGGGRWFLRTGKGEREVRIERTERRFTREREPKRDKIMELSVLRNRELTRYDGEFDPGSERTLAARIKHASRTGVWGFGPA
jgi:hypothetical protein